ncbi:MAG: DUF4040 domain-containing protein [Lachnospiraceae bacterium]|nr:DUF4040 domain-containing protein [Lachnospiraceae bacterium]
MTIIEIFLLVFLIVCAVSVFFIKRLLNAVIVFMSYSAVMAVLWLSLESPDLAITEAAVGCGVTTLLFILTLKKVNALKEGEGVEEDESAV